jgi:hypothetical protein
MAERMAKKTAATATTKHTFEKSASFVWSTGAATRVS